MDCISFGESCNKAQAKRILQGQSNAVKINLIEARRGRRGEGEDEVNVPRGTQGRGR